MKLYEKHLIEGLSFAIDITEKNYLSHSKHVAYIALSIGTSLDLPQERLENIYYAALIHDIGAGNSYDIMDHNQNGVKLGQLLNINPEIIEIIRLHHENFEGTGPFSSLNTLLGTCNHKYLGLNKWLK